MAVAEVLAQNGMSLSSSVNIHARCVEIVEEVEDLFVARRSVTTTGLLF